MISWRKNTAKLEPSAPKSEVERRFVFVTGHPRSGTNWVSSLLNLHPECWCDGEFHFLILRWAMDGFTSLPWYQGAIEPQRSAAELAFQRLIRECMTEKAKVRLAEKGRELPAVLGDHTPRLFRLMITPPEARYLVIQRDGRDVLVSYTFHLLNTKAPDVIPESIRGFYQQQLSSLDGTPEAQKRAGIALLSHEGWVRYYANFWSEHILHDKRIWQSVASQGFGAYVKFLRYEDLLADVEAGRRGIYEHLGLDPALAAPVSAETNTFPGFGGREDVTSFYRKGHAGDWLRYFTPAIGRWFHETAGQAMAVAGYETDGAWVGRIGEAQRGTNVAETKTTEIKGPSPVPPATDRRTVSTTTNTPVLHS